MVDQRETIDRNELKHDNFSPQSNQIRLLVKHTTAISSSQNRKQVTLEFSYLEFLKPNTDFPPGISKKCRAWQVQ
jgi:hypothetical protein